MKLVIVESPTKAKTIRRFLSKDYTVESSFGHIRDLPQSASEIPAAYKGKAWARLGVNVEEKFQPLYVIPKEKKKQVTKLKQLLKDAEALYLATDEDREGEAISWHLLEVLQPNVPIYRLVFHEITRDAIQAALANPRTIDMHLVEAQETRRILDRLYGYEVSPVLWRKVAPKLSAGRVQSAALQLIVEREQQRIQFRSNLYWDITGTFTTDRQEQFEAKIYSINQQRVASGKDFDSTTGNLTTAATQQVVVLDQPKAEALAKQLENTTWEVIGVQQRPITSSPYAPFITSTLQQEAGRKLGLSASKTMHLAQRLYEQGIITYMRTDSVQLSQEAITAARSKISELYGQEYLPTQPRSYKNKNKTAQEAHEAIRPAGTLMSTPAELPSELQPDEYRLYDLIWKRTVASQMANAELLQTTVNLQHEAVVFQAHGQIIKFPGYFRVYVEGSDDPEAQLLERENALPALKEQTNVSAKTMEPKNHETKPPARFTEASLVKELEARGIGRPSTYATIIDTILRRGYIYKDSSALVPRFVAFAVVALLHNHFSNLVDTKYTAAMEEDLDEIAAGSKTYLPYLQAFYFGNTDQIGLHNMLKADIDARSTCTIPLGKATDGYPINVRVGRFGPFVEHVLPNQAVTASIPADLPPDKLTLAVALSYIEKHSQGPTKLGLDPKTQQPVYLLEGHFGPYVQLGDKSPDKKKGAKQKMKGLLRGMDPKAITLAVALQLLSLPRVLGKHPSLREDIITDNGRFGPYIKCGNETRSLKAEDNLLTLTLERAIELLNTPKTGRGLRSSSVLKELGEYPATKELIQLCNGHYGPYLKVGKKNVGLPKGLDPKALNLAKAVELVEKKLK